MRCAGWRDRKRKIMIRVIFNGFARQINPSFSSEGKGRPGIECFLLKRKKRADISGCNDRMPKIFPGLPLRAGFCRLSPRLCSIFAFISTQVSIGLLLPLRIEGVFLYGVANIFLDRMGKIPDRTQFNRPFAAALR
jgi:hypothetical protein